MAQGAPAEKSGGALAAAGLAECCLPAGAAAHAAPNGLARCSLPDAARATDYVANRPPGLSTVVGCGSAWSCASPTRRTADVLLCGYRAIQRGWHACRYRRATEHASGRGGRSRELETQQVPAHGHSDY